MTLAPRKKQKKTQLAQVQSTALVCLIRVSLQSDKHTSIHTYIYIYHILNSVNQYETIGIMSPCKLVHVPGLACSYPRRLPLMSGIDGPVWSAAELTQIKTKVSQ